MDERNSPVFEILPRAASAFGVTLTEDALDRFNKYAKLLKDANERMNLVADASEAVLAARHFADSLAVMPYLPSDARNVLDIGSGAGFPGFPAVLARPGISLTCVEATGKKADFLRETSAALGLCVRVECARAEELGHSPAFRARYDAVLSRAVASLGMLCELTLPFLRTGGVLIALKGPGAPLEAEQAENAVKILGGGNISCFPYRLEGMDTDFHAVVIKKISQTSAKYPRKFAQIKSNPL